MPDKKEPDKKEPLKIKANAPMLIGALLENDLRIEVMFQALVEQLRDKDLIDYDKFQERAKELHKEATKESSKLVKPPSGIILPDGGSV